MNEPRTNEQQVLPRAGTARPRRPLNLLRPVEGRAAGPALPTLRRARVGLVVSDAVALLAAVTFIATMRPEIRGLSGRLLLPMAVAVIAQMVVFAALGLYRLWRMPAWDEFRRLVGATGIWVIVLTIATPWWNAAVSRSFLVSMWLIALAFLFPIRAAFRWGLRRAKTDEVAMRTAIVGTGAEATRMAHHLSDAAREVLPVGYVGLEPHDAGGDGLPVLGSLGELSSIITREGIECLLIPSTGLSDDDVMQVSRACRRANIEMKVWANVPDILGSRLSVQPMNGHVALALEPVRLTPMQAILKRSFDLLVASLCLLVALPALVVMALAIRLTSRGPVLFRQPRVTKDGRVFTMYKFRTMVSDQRKALDEATVDLTRPFFKLKDDPRLTRVGRILRHLSLDELPQLLNVLKGDMSMVGPRPLPAEQVEANADSLAPRHEVRGGITGWWQISGRSGLDSEQALRMDLWYIENWSLGLDLYILVRTLGAVLARRGAW